MSQAAVVIPSTKRSKKDIRNTIREKLLVSLADYRSIVGEKKFDNRIRKTARRLGEDIIKALPKKQKKVKKITLEKSS
ncbi:MAG: hypothetical protein ABUT20_18120 [Bacteroidota bacterium]